MDFITGFPCLLALDRVRDGSLQQEVGGLDERSWFGNSAPAACGSRQLPWVVTLTVSENQVSR